ncbi:LOW QUALITY PROTEIN: reverse transcriptase [Phytophthora megakarya]|uniref:Reverse transcriptase n=1 Tax=Phytophthora megakarya TaxID=4795 RepID=A0A225W2Q4_9STRA|nr:LOW QUALITY PROTEIN: reverse transcriptase [Phytophthora megakarya]
MRYMPVSAEELNLEPAVYILEGSELMSQLNDQLVMLPDLEDLSPECDIEAADVGEPDESTEVQEKQLKAILKRRQKIFFGDGNAAPPPARGAICDLDVGDAKPVAQRPRSVGPHLAIKIYKLLKKLLEATPIEHPESPWASPIVIVLKKNGVDIRMCIDYRVVNSFIHLSNYPLPLIDDLITGFEGMIWFMSLDMASGFWALRMSERAKLISAFTYPFGHFQWVRMPFGLKNVPLIYQQMINNCLWGFVRLPPEEEALVDQDVLDYLKLDPQSPSDEIDVERSMTPLVEQMTDFRRNIPAPSQMGPALGRSSYIDDIAHGAATLDQLCGDLDALLYRLRYWSISFAQERIREACHTIYLSHEIGAEGIRATPKIVKGIQELAFPSTLKGVQSFLGRLNYYHKFIEDYAVVAASLYELTDDQVRAGRDLSRAKESFEILKRKITSGPNETFRDHASCESLAACAVLGQMHDRLVQPFRFTGRVLNDAELKYHFAEKEVLAVMRVFHVFKNLIEGFINSKTTEGRLVPWGVALSQYDLEIRKVCRDEDGLAAIMGASITPREHLDKVAEVLIPAKGRVKPPPVCRNALRRVLSFDGAAKTSTRTGSCGCILWHLPDWKVVDARGYILDGVTVNDAEYFGLLKGLAMALERGIQDIVVVGDSRIVIQQVQGLINCNQPNLQRRLAECETLEKRFQTVRLVHMKREFNEDADYLTSKTLVQGESWTVQDDLEKRHLEVIREQLVKPSEGTNTRIHCGEPINDSGKEDGVSGTRHGPGPECAPLSSAARVMAVLTRSRAQEVDDDEVPPIGPLEFQAERWRRIKVHQESDECLAEIRAFLNDDLDRFSSARLKKIGKVADLFVLDDRGIIWTGSLELTSGRHVAPMRMKIFKADIKGSPGLMKSYVLNSTGPAIMWTSNVFGKGAHPNAGPSSGNIEPQYPFEAVSMDFVVIATFDVRQKITAAKIKFFGLQRQIEDYCSINRRLEDRLRGGTFKVSRVMNFLNRHNAWINAADEFDADPGAYKYEVESHDEESKVPEVPKPQITLKVSTVDLTEPSSTESTPVKIQRKLFGGSKPKALTDFQLRFSTYTASTTDTLDPTTAK